MQFYRESEPLLSADLESPKLRGPVAGWILLFLAVAVVCSYLIYMPDQRNVESRFAAELARRFRWYPLEVPDTPITNLTQVLYGSRGGYTYQWHEWFRNYGASAGFTHSLAEKFVMAPPGVFHRNEEIYLVSAQPFFERRAARRMVFYRRTNDVWAEAVAEEWVQAAFAEAKQQIPAPSVEPKPPSPPSSTSRNPGHYYLSAWLETRGLFSRLEWWGLTPRTARVVEKLFWLILCSGWMWITGYCLRTAPARIPEAEPPRSAPLTTAQKIWSVIGLTLLFIFSLGFLFPAMGGDRSYEELYLYLLFPYSAASELWGFRGAHSSSLAAILIWAEILAYDLALSVGWIRNRLRFTATVLAVIHLSAIAFCIVVLLLKKSAGY